MTTQEIIDDIFHLHVDDTTELSDEEELKLANRVYQAIAAKRPWEFLRTEKSGFLSASVPYIDLPDDFLYFAENNNYSEDTFAVDSDTPSKVIYVGDNYDPYKIVNFADRRKYRNNSNTAYADIAAGKIYFTVQPADAYRYDFDYIAKPADLTADSEPVFPIRHDIIGYGMAVDGFLIQLFPKNQSYAAENQAKFMEAMADLEFYNANLRVN